MSNFSISTIHHDLLGDMSKNVLARMHNSMNFRAIAYARMHLKQDALGSLHVTQETRGYKRFSNEPNIDDRNEADVVNAVTAANAQGVMGLAPMMPAAELVDVFMKMRDFFNDRLNAIGIRNKYEDPTSINDSINYLIDRAPRDSNIISTMAAALEIDPATLVDAEFMNVERERKDLIDCAGNVITYLGKFADQGIDEYQVEAAFDKLPAQVQYKIIAKVINVYESTASFQLQKVLRGGNGSMDAASNYKMLKAKRKEAVTWLTNFSARKRAELNAYMDAGGELPEFDCDIITSNDKQREVVAPSAATEAAYERLGEDKVKMKRAPAPVK